jgi:hypothetical protein
VRYFSGTVVCVLALARGALAAAPPPCTNECTSGSEANFANFGFASELGSGVYEIGGSVLQVYQLPLGYRLRYAERPEGQPGLRLILPVTVGFLNYQTQDLVHFELPTQIGALSLEPGVQFDYWMNEDWHVYPYVKAGATFASSSAVNAWIYGVGVRSDFRFSFFDGAGLWSSELNHAGVHYYHAATDSGQSVPSDHFTRWRNGAELRHLFGAPFRERRWEAGVYGVADIYLDAPQGAASGISANTLQYETGLMFGLNPMYQVWGITVPRLGIGYRFAGQYSGWRLVIGEPF